jgi:hypothetical protein
MSTSMIVVMAICANSFVALGGFGLWLSYRARRRRPLFSDDEIAGQLRQIRESIDALSVEVERIGESQRYTARLLHDASTMRATFPAPPQKSVTPH